MAEKKKGPGRPKRTGDRHASNFVVRLAEPCREMLDVLCEINSRSRSQELRLALEDRYKSVMKKEPTP